MVWNLFSMKRLAFSKLGTVKIDPDGPTRGPSFHALWRTGRQIHDKCTTGFTNLYRMLHQWLETASL